MNSMPPPTIIEEAAANLAIAIAEEYTTQTIARRLGEFAAAILATARQQSASPSHIHPRPGYEA